MLNGALSIFGILLFESLNRVYFENTLKLSFGLNFVYFLFSVLWERKVSTKAT